MQLIPHEFNLVSCNLSPYLLVLIPFDRVNRFHFSINDHTGLSDKTHFTSSFSRMYALNFFTCLIVLAEPSVQR